jgi:hypothetical protein
MSKYTFNEKNHAHMLGNKRLHGVTTVLKYWGDPGALVNWAARTACDYVKKNKDRDLMEVLEEAKTAHLKKRDKAGDIGTKVHGELEDAINEWIKDGCVSLDHSQSVLDVLYWLKDNDFVPYKTEAHLHSEELWLGGIVDLICIKDKKTYIMDFKTSNTVQTKHLYQMGAYSKMWKEQTKQDVAGLCIIHIPKGKFSPDKGIYMRHDVLELEDAFENILSVYKLDKDVQKLIAY